MNKIILLLLTIYPVHSQFPNARWNNNNVNPLQTMVDATNKLGIKVLHEHNFLNDNNIAFSPYGLGCVMIAIYEAVEGETLYQVQRGTEFPWNKRIVRTGFGDIHETLKTYFYPEDGFLNGLTFNSDNITFKVEYVEKLQFYGFEIVKNETGDNSTDSNNVHNVTPSATFGTPPGDTNTSQEDGDQQSSTIVEGVMSTSAQTQALIMASTPTTTMRNLSPITPNSDSLATTMIDIYKNETVTSTTSSNSEINNVSMEMTTLKMSDTTTNTRLSESAIGEIDSSTTSTTMEMLTRKKRTFRDVIYAPPEFYEEDFVYDEISSPLIRDEAIFMAHGRRSIEVEYMNYDMISEYAYFNFIRATVLKLPLDNENYNLLILLPDYGEDTGSLLKSLTDGYKLREIILALEPRIVRAKVPSFMMSGGITLTRDLQMLGMRSMFEPRQRDFTLMTNDDGVYVRNIEQFITISVTKYNQTNNGQTMKNVFDTRPVHFAATRPFVFFIVDTKIHLALIAGKIMDPINSRIL